MPEPDQDFWRAVVDHLAKQQWSLCECGLCGLTFLSSPEAQSCGRRPCSNLTAPPSSTGFAPQFPEQLWQLIRAHFAEAAFVQMNRSDIANPSCRATRFVGAGLQLFEDAIEEKAPVPAGALFVPQPVIRLNYWDAVGRVQGTSTSFLNLCTEEARASMPDFLRHLDVWLGLLKRLKIKRSDLRIIPGKERWRGGPFGGPCIIFEVGGTEIGDAILIDEGTESERVLLPIVDFSFGLERISYVVNAGLPYYAFLGPLPEASAPVNERSIDRIRTATLICLTGITPSSKGRGRELRRSMQDITEQPPIDLCAAVRHAYRYWTGFITPQREESEVVSILEREFARARTLHITRGLQIKHVTAHLDSMESTDEACRKLLSSGVGFATLTSFHLNRQEP